jgi:SAM-dependent methyltransferase
MGVVDSIAGHPVVFNFIQSAAGRTAIIHRLQPWLNLLTGHVLDVGGGTGRLRGDLRPDVRYICLDLELRKLRYAPAGLLADAAALPFASGTFSGALLIGVSHHLEDDVLDNVIGDIARILVPRGRLIMLDAVSVPTPKLTSRMLWRLDRGHYLRSRAALTETLQKRFTVEDAVSFDVLHHYFAANCVRSGGAAAC